MKKWFLHILLLAGLFGMLTTSCSQEVDGLDQEIDGKVQVMFTIALDDPSTGSRAIWGDNYDNNTDNDYESAIGDEFDNYINPDQLFVTLTIGSNTYDVKNIVHWQTGDNVYEFMGEVDGINQTNGTVEAKIQVYANMSSTSTSTFEPDYNINQTTGFVTNPNGVSYIPMWGVQTATISLIPGERNDLTEEAPIYLLRAMAKVEVNMNVDGYTLTNVTLNKYNTQGNCLPAGATTLTDTKTLHYDNEIGYCFNPNTTSTSALSFNVTGNHLVFYLPEVANGTKDSANELYMTVTLQKGGQTVTLTKPYLYFRNYDETSGKADNATPFDIVRNHWYQYNITGINSGADLEIIITLNAWNYRNVSYDNTPLT